MKNFEEINRTFTVKKTKLFNNAKWLLAVALAVISNQLWASDSGISASDGVFVIDFYDSDALSSTSGTNLSNSNYSSFVKVATGLTKTNVVTSASVTGTVRYGMNGGLTAGNGTASGADTHYVTFNIGSDYAVNKVTVYAAMYESGKWQLNGSDADNQASATYAAKGSAFSTITKPLVWDELDGITSLTFKKMASGGGNLKRLTIYTIVCEYSSCDKSVNIQKGSETNGTFTISPNGSQASCDGVAVTVTPTPASSAYYCSAVSASTGETGTDNGNGTWTVNIAANTTGTSTINVTFSLKTSYTVTWYNEGVSIGTESVYSGDKVSALPSPNPSSSCSGTFFGWVKSDAAVVNKNVTDAYTTMPSVFTNVAGSPAITGKTDFHAVYKMPKPD